MTTLPSDEMLAETLEISIEEVAGLTEEEKRGLLEEQEFGPEEDYDPFAPQPAKLPRGFHFKSGAIFHTDENDKEKFVCAHLEVIGRVRDPDSSGWARLLKWLDPDKHEHIVPVSDAKLHGDVSALCAELSDQGLKISTTGPARRLFLQLLNNSVPEDIFTVVKKTGWHTIGGDDVFVLPDATIGASNVILSRSLEHAYKSRGSLADWKSTVASAAIGNSRLVLAISTALAPPLLRLCGFEPGGVHLRGQSSTGKTTTLRVAASVWGGPPKDYIKAWRATSNGLEGVAAAHCDSLLILDELSQVAAKEAGAIAYMLANGSGKARANREGGVRAVAQWRLLFLSSGEISIADKVSEDGHGKRATAGQQVRIVDVPADAGEGSMFEDTHGRTGQEFADYLSSAAAENYGTAAPLFIERILGQAATAQTLVEEIHADLLSGVGNAHGQVARAAHRLAVIAAAGELGIHYELLPWPDETAIRGIGKCFRDWFEVWGGPGAIELRRGVQAVRQFFELHGEARFQPFYSTDERPVHNRAGFRKTTPEGTEWFVLPSVWREDVCRGFDMVALNRELVRLKILNPGPGGKSTSSVHKLAPLGPGAHRVYHVSHTVLEGEED